MAASREPGIANRRARHDYFITDTLTCGIKLTGTEIKSIRAGQISLKEGYVRASDKPLSLTLHGVHIAEYPGAGPKHQHEPIRVRTLLANKREIRKWAVASRARGSTIVPLEIVWVESRAKLVIGLGTGKKKHDKRQALRKKAHARDMERR
ncbi:MAG: SsrA-binding protein SmpB [Phycisphaerales bacterium]|nr:SsrA-binding protein SmpB [Phycisphaerales bacterium]